MATRDPFLVLSVERGATADEIRRAWRERARIVHPDVGGSVAAMQELNEALHSALGYVEESTSVKVTSSPVLVFLITRSQ